MNQRLADMCRRAASPQQSVLMTALVAADPYLDATVEYMKVLADQGADLIELIFPFSEMTYHGAVIQRAASRALREEISWHEIVELGQTFRQTHDTPVFFSTYYNRVLARGTDAFVGSLADADFDGAMVTDLPWEEGGQLRAALADKHLALPSAVAPTTDPERFEQIAQGTDSFLIWTGHSGGDLTISLERFRDCMNDFYTRSDLPILASMKISTGQEARAVAAHCDGVLVGSALVWLVEGRGADVADSLAELVRELRRGIDGEELDPPQTADEP